MSVPRHQTGASHRAHRMDVELAEPQPVRRRCIVDCRRYYDEGEDELSHDVGYCGLLMV